MNVRSLALLSLSGRRPIHTEVIMGTSNLIRPTVRFGAYELDLQAGVLRKNGMRLCCQEQPLQVLAVLVEHAGELVSREELRRRVWPRDTFVDFDHALNTAVKKIRATLNDDADAPRYIETVPRRGYRFVASVEQEAEAGVPPTIVAPVREVPARNYRRPAIIGLAAVIVIALIGVGWKYGGWGGSNTATPPEFQRLTFDQPELGDARFTPDAASVVYTSGGHSHSAEILSLRFGASAYQSLALPHYVLLSISRQGELALMSSTPRPTFEMVYKTDSGTLASVPLGGGTPRELIPDVEAADWSPNGQLAIVRRVGHRSRLEFPIGKVLYESAGWIASPRFSPSGNAIAFLDHPVIPDDRGTVTLINLTTGEKRTISGFWESARGLAWNPRGDEIWFAAARSGVSRELNAVSLDGRERQVLSAAGGLSLQDISHDGRILVTRDNEKLGMLFMRAGEQEPRDLSFRDWSMAADLSADGKQLLFGEEGESSGFSYQVGLRSTDGSAPMILGSGVAQSLSPDGKWALSIMPPPNDQIVLLPTGAGATRSLERGPVEHYEFAGAKWFSDSERIVFVGYEASRGQHCYVQSIEGGQPRAIPTDEAISCTVSPGGRILVESENHHAFLYASDTSEQPEKEFVFDRGELPGSWTADGKYLYLAQMEQRPIVVSRLEITSGKRQFWKKLPDLPQNIELKGERMVTTPDGQAYAYTYSRHFSDLYLVQGAK
jgi:DNA-binding winged helix-turn-helix (wHTH) protein/Tol biopolymer transport system component